MVCCESLDIIKTYESTRESCQGWSYQALASDEHEYAWRIITLDKDRLEGILLHGISSHQI